MLKEMSLASGKSYLLTEDEAMVIMAEMAKGGKASVFIKRLGMAVNIASVMSVADPETVPYFWGMRMNESMTKLWRDGEWVAFSGGEEYIKQIEYRLKSNPEIVIEKNKIQLT